MALCHTKDAAQSDEYQHKQLEIIYFKSPDLAFINSRQIFNTWFVRHYNVVLQ